MTEQKHERPAVAGPGVDGGELCDVLAFEDSTNARPSKAAILLEALLRGEQLTRMDAWKRLGDGCANTTVSNIQSRHGVQIARELIEVPGRRRAAKVALYWLEQDQHDAARQALARELKGRRHGGEEG